MPTDRQELRYRLVAVASLQGGYFTAAQALEAGYGYSNQKFHLDRGNWTRVDRGIFRLPEWPIGVHDDLVRWSLWALGRAVISHVSALTVHGYGEFESSRVNLTVPLRFSKADPAVVLHRAVLNGDDFQVREGFRVTTVMRSLIDVASAGADQHQLASAISEALDAGAITLRRLRELAEEVDVRAALRIEQALGTVNR
jgi:predicted transcriptional regulator of viral defense system